MQGTPPFRRVDGIEDDYEEGGQVTGYAAIDSPLPAGFARPPNHAFDTDENPHSSIAGNKAGSLQKLSLPYLSASRGARSKLYGAKSDIRSSAASR